MNTTNQKYTVILSAYNQDAAPVNNLLASDALYNKAANLQGGFVNPIRAVGAYMGNIEQSFIVHTNSSNIVEELKRLAWDFKQDCILVSNNRKNVIRLYYPETAPLEIGERFAINNKLEGNGLLSYTIVDGEYWEVI